MIKKFKEGDECITVGRFGSKCANFKSGGQHLSIPIWSAKTYVAKKNYKGELKWFLKGCFGRTVASKRVPNSLTNSISNFPNYVVWCEQYKKV